ncbi:MAG: tRNA (adenosine(37)-N6)-threonylcarbamoyltransferase complex transferase subunit TsaD [Chitinispirillales bacterium]|jgi:N6-L-threonylcarbamoyladenine synthase|nr:tRNA (adenosine(37)-N6)-threonylcarbamoyltransferase complex transferase subunit TsaD [Chitinispirillales bacterium]
MLILGIESSCDETSVAVLEDGKILASLTHTQEEHAAYGGVVPEVASRAHLEKIDLLAERALSECGVAPKQLDLIAVTDSPGLAGALLVGVSFALGLHTAYGIPVTGVNHLEGHICSLFIDRPDVKPPFLVLLASGGHTAIYEYQSSQNCKLLGQTVDDAAGEAFDKVGKLIGFPYPAGRSIELEAAKAKGSSGITFPIARFSPQAQSKSQNRQNFSFSGLKTAVKIFISAKDSNYINDNRPEICHAFQKAVVGSLTDNLEAASKSSGIKTIAISGGVACNTYLREELKKRFGDNNVIFPPPPLCTDNGAMIAMAGYMMYIDRRTRFPNMDPGRGI